MRQRLISILPFVIFLDTARRKKRTMSVQQVSLKILCSFLWLSIFSACAGTHVQLPTVRFAVNTPGSSPYLYFDERSQRYQGVVVDFFNSPELSSQFSVVYLDSNRNRSEQLLKAAAVDVFLSSESWLEQPSDFLISRELIKHDSYLYSTSVFSSPFDVKANNNTSICTRYGFVYPTLQSAFENAEHNVTRVNSSSHLTMAMMLSKGRCDFAIMNEYNALSVMFNERFCSTSFFKSPNVISQVSVAFVIRSDLPQLKEKVDKGLKLFIESGQRQRSIELHSGVNRFPKHQC